MTFENFLQLKLFTISFKFCLLSILGIFVYTTITYSKHICETLEEVFYSSFITKYSPPAETRMEANETNGGKEGEWV